MKSNNDALFATRVNYTDTIIKCLSTDINERVTKFKHIYSCLDYDSSVGTKIIILLNDMI